MNNDITLPVFNIERFAIHDGPGIRTTVFLQGCPLRCKWCANPEAFNIGKNLMHFQNKCKNCGACINSCPSKAINYKKKEIYIDRMKCTNCGICTTTCLNKANLISGKEMTLNEVYEILIRDIPFYKSSSGGVTFSGGEASLYIEKLIPLLNRLKKENITIAFETCGNIEVEKIKQMSIFTDYILYDIKTLNEKTLFEFTNGDLNLILNNL